MSRAPGGQCKGVPYSSCPRSLAAIGVSLLGWGYPSLEWQGWFLGSQAGGRGMLMWWQHILDPVLCWVPLFHPSRVRQLEEELRTMDQTLKSLIASEEEVLVQGRGAMCSRPPLSVSVPQTMRATSVLFAPLPPPPTSPCLPLQWAQPGHTPPSLHPCSPWWGQQ